MPPLKLKPTHAPVKAYYQTLAQFSSGHHDNEGNIRRAFEELLTKCARQFDWFLVSEYQIVRPAKMPLRVAAALLAACTLHAQSCPQDSANGPANPSQPLTLQGKLVYHDGIRQWFELRLDQPQCSQSSIQVIPNGDDWSPIQVLRGCRVRSTGEVYESPTGYYSLDLAQSVTTIEPVGTCTRQPLLPGESKAKPDPAIRQYRVEMDFLYASGDHPIHFRVTSAGKELHPWQAYASYTLTGGFVLYGHCANGFVVGKIFGTPQANPSHFTEPRDASDMAAYDPESAASSGQKNLHLGYTCIRKP